MKIRINDLARELEVKSKAILDVLTEVGVTEKKTHSSSLEEHEAELVRKCLGSHAESGSASARSSRPAVHAEEEIKTKIDLSHISRPGDVLRAITQQKEATEHPVARPAIKPPVAPVAKPPVAAPAIEAKAEAPAAPLRLRSLRLPSRLHPSSLRRLPSPHCGRPRWLLFLRRLRQRRRRALRRTAPAVSAAIRDTGGKRSASNCRSAADSADIGDTSGHGDICAGTGSKRSGSASSSRKASSPGTAAAAHDHAANGPASGIQSAGAAAGSAPAARYRAGPFPDSQSSSARRGQPRRDRVRLCVPANGGRCIQRALLPPDRVRSALDRAHR